MNMMNSAKKFALKNKERIADGVDKATDMVDKKTNGKYHDKLQKADEAAAKFAGKPKDAEVPEPAEESVATDAAASASSPAATPSGSSPADASPAD